MSEKTDTKIPEWIIPESQIPPKMRVLCPDEDRQVILRGWTAQRKGELQAKQERLSDFEYTKEMIRSSVQSWTVDDMEGSPLPQLNDIPTAKGEQDIQIWSKLPAVTMERILLGIMILENPMGVDGLGGDIKKALSQGGD